MRNLFIEDKKSGLIWLWLSLLIFVIDQLSKYYISAHFQLHEVKQVLPFFNLTLAYNTGAAFSFLSDAGGWQRWAFAVISIAISTLLVAWLSRTSRHHYGVAISFALILGGALGNLYDRVFFGCVYE